MGHIFPIFFANYTLGGARKASLLKVLPSQDLAPHHQPEEEGNFGPLRPVPKFGPYRIQIWLRELSG